MKELVLDLRSLGLFKKPGEWIKYTMTVGAPEDLRNEMIGVPTGDPLDIELQLESVDEGIYVTGTVSATAKGQDARTLEDMTLPLNVDITELFVYDRPQEDEDSYEIENGMLDLEPAVRDALVMSLPFRPLKSGEEGEFHYTVGDVEEPVDDTDPRWSTLKSLLTEEKES